jgi:hypothetical protein
MEIVHGNANFKAKNFPHGCPQFAALFPQLEEPEVARCCNIPITLKTPEPRRTDGANLCYGLVSTVGFPTYNLSDAFAS